MSAAGNTLEVTVHWCITMNGFQLLQHETFNITVLKIWCPESQSQTLLTMSFLELYSSMGMSHESTNLNKHTVTEVWQNTEKIIYLCFAR